MLCISQRYKNTEIKLLVHASNGRSSKAKFVCINMIFFSTSRILAGTPFEQLLEQTKDY